MKPSRIFHGTRFLQTGVAALVLAGPSHAQTPEPAVSPAARLEQLDGTYSANLRKYHAPVLLDYLRDLEKLRQTLTTQGRGDEAAKVQAELDKTKQLSATTGLLSYDPLKPPPPPAAATPAPENEPHPKGTRRFSPDALMLTTSTALNAQPPPTSITPRPDTTALPLGHAEWHIAKVPAGIYEVMLICNFVEGAAKSTVQATLGSLSVERKIPANGSNGLNDFRVFRVGTVTLDQDLSDTVLTLEGSDPAKPCVWVRNVILTHPKPPPGEGRPPGKRPPPPGEPPAPPLKPPGDPGPPPGEGARRPPMERKPGEPPPGNP